MFCNLLGSFNSFSYTQNHQERQLCFFLLNRVGVFYDVSNFCTLIIRNANFCRTKKTKIEREDQYMNDIYASPSFLYVLPVYYFGWNVTTSLDTEGRNYISLLWHKQKMRDKEYTKIERDSSPNLNLQMNYKWGIKFILKFSKRNIL